MKKRFALITCIFTFTLAKAQQCQVFGMDQDFVVECPMDVTSLIYTTDTGYIFNETKYVRVNSLTEDVKITAKGRFIIGYGRRVTPVNLGVVLDDCSIERLSIGSVGRNLLELREKREEAKKG